MSRTERPLVLWRNGEVLNGLCGGPPMACARRRDNCDCNARALSMSGNEN